MKDLQSTASILAAEVSESRELAGGDGQRARITLAVISRLVGLLLEALGRIEAAIRESKAPPKRRVKKAAKRQRNG